MSNSKISALTSATTPLAGTETLPVVQSSATKQVSVANLTAGRAVTGASFSASTWVAGQAPRQNPNTSGTTVDYALRAADNVGSIALDMGQSNLPSVNSAWMQVRNQGNFALNYNLAIQPNGGVVSIGSMANPVSGAMLTVFNGNVALGTAGKGVSFTANTPAAGMTSQLLNWYEEGTWTPVVTSGTGTITSYIAAGRYTRIGRQVTLTWYIGVTNNGTGASYIHITGAPYSSGVGNTALFGFNQSTGAACTGAINGTALNMYKYDATYPVATGQTINGSITYSV